MSEPDWKSLVLGYLVNREEVEESDLDSPEAWRHAYATLMSMRGQVEPPEVLADLADTVRNLERSADTTQQMNRRIFESQEKEMRGVHKRLDLLEGQVLHLLERCLAHNGQGVSDE